MGEWRETTLGDLIASGDLSMSDGYRTKRGELGRPGFRIIRVADIGDGTVSLQSPDFVSESMARQVGTKRGRPGDILLTTKGTVGRVAVLPEIAEPVVYSPQLCYFRVKPGGRVSHGYLRQWFRSDEFWRQARDRMNNTDMAAYINLADLRSMRVAIPLFPEQRAIAEVLGALDDKIAANTRLANMAESLAVALSSSAPPSIALDRIATATRVMIDPASRDGAVVDLFSLPGFDAGQIPERVEPSSIKSGKFLIESPAVLVSKLNPRIPRIWEVPELSQVASVASTEFVVLNPKDTSTSTLWALLSQQYFSATLESMVAGTSGSHQRVKPDQIMSTLVGDPASLSDSERHRIDALCRCAYAARRENLTLAGTRDALLPALMSGKVSVRSAERLAGNLV